MANLEKCPAPKDPGALPPARHFENMGQLFMRSGDGPDDTYALFACGGVLSQHRHYDANHFVIYQQGHLALDTGTRHGNTDNLQNYYAQTVAHNCVLIKMPGEAPSPYWNGKVYGQAGGQYQQLGSKVVAFETDPHFTYVAGDATATYRPEKCSQMIRQFVFIPPDHFVVFDRAASTKPEYAKRWLLHHAHEPVVDGRTWRSDQHRGRIFCRTLLPEDAVLEKVGGPGKEFLADGVNYALTAGVSDGVKDLLPTTTTLTYKETPELMGRWRMEVKPGNPRTADLFLHLIQVGGQSLQAMCQAEAETNSGVATVRFQTEASSVRLTVNTTGNVGGHITIARDGETLVDRDLTQDVMPQEGLASLP
jgi:heparin/heparan-sulfate lyase